MVATLMNSETSRGDLMPQSLSRVLLHVAFSTKNRAPVLSRQIQSELHPYLGGVLNSMGCSSIQVGGVEDHVHLFFMLSRTKTIAQVVEKVKTSSSKWLKEQDRQLSSFFWQNGYGVFSISQSDHDAVVAYVANQEERHRKISFQDEYRRLLELYQIEYDEKYVWD